MKLIQTGGTDRYWYYLLPPHSSIHCWDIENKNYKKCKKPKLQIKLCMQFKNGMSLAMTTTEHELSVMISAVTTAK